MATAATIKKIEALKIKLEQAKALAQKQDAIAKKKELIRAGEDSRKEDTRRKILVGAYMLSTLKGDGLKGLYLEMLDYVTRDEDRALFIMPTAPETTA